MKKLPLHRIERAKQTLREGLSFENLRQLLQYRDLSMEDHKLLVTNVIEICLRILEPYIGITNSLIELVEVKNMLNYKDFRSVITWCRKNGVFVYEQGNCQYVNQTEFQLAFHKPFLNYLRGNSKNWRELFVKYVQGDLLGLLPNEEVEVSKNKAYKSNSQVEKSFLKRIKGL